MNAEYKKRWIAALRSKEYTQAQGSLLKRDTTKNDDVFPVCGHCCLGVLSDLVARDGKAYWAGNSIIVPNDEEPEAYRKSDVDLPLTMRQIVGLENGQSMYASTVPLPFKLRDSEIKVSLVDLNDGPDNLNFDQLADVIEHFL